MSEVEKIDLRKASNDQLVTMLLTMSALMEATGDFSIPVGVIREAARRLGGPQVVPPEFPSTKSTD